MCICVCDRDKCIVLQQSVAVTRYTTPRKQVFLQRSTTVKDFISDSQKSNTMSTIQKNKRQKPSVKSTISKQTKSTKTQKTSPTTRN